MLSFALYAIINASMLFPLAMGGSSEEPVAKKGPEHTVDEQGEEVVLRDSIYYIDVISATWGMNCHGKERISRYGTMDLHNHGLYEVEKDNVLEFLKEQCNDEQTCEVANFDSYFEGVKDPAENCKKELDISFRCFNYDVARPLKLKHERKVVLDCALDKE